MLSHVNWWSGGFGQTRLVALIQNVRVKTEGLSCSYVTMMSKPHDTNTGLFYWIIFRNLMNSHIYRFLIFCMENGRLVHLFIEMYKYPQKCSIQGKNCSVLISLIQYLVSPPFVFNTAWTLWEAFLSFLLDFMNSSQTFVVSMISHHLSILRGSWNVLGHL